MFVVVPLFTLMRLFKAKRPRAVKGFLIASAVFIVALPLLLLAACFMILDGSHL